MMLVVAVGQGTRIVTRMAPYERFNGRIAGLTLRWVRSVPAGSSATVCWWGRLGRRGEPALVFSQEYQCA